MLAMRLGDLATEFMGLWSALSAILLMLVVVLLSLYLSLGIHKETIVATFRCVHLGSDSAVCLLIYAIGMRAWRISRCRFTPFVQRPAGH